MPRYHALKYKKEIVGLFNKRPSEVTESRFALIHSLNLTTVREWARKYSTGQSEDKLKGVK